ncbi:MAG: hypothetical protein F4X77_19190 [Acidobacteriia bacterium]|nr:hypothetical protein [Terriglobia bacterium]
MAHPKPRPFGTAWAYAGLGIRGAGGFLFAAAILILWAGTLPAQQASYGTNWDPGRDQGRSGSLSSCGGSSSDPGSGSDRGSTNRASSAPTVPASSSSTSQPPPNDKISDQQPSNGSSKNRYKRLDRQIGMPVFLAGRVVLASGEGLYKPAEIVLSCGGQPIPQGHTDNKGQFDFEPLCPPLLPLSDPSMGKISGPPGFFHGPPTTTATKKIRGCEAARGGFPSPTAAISARNLPGCELHAELKGFRSSRVQLGTVRGSTRMDVGLITLYPLHGLTGSPASATTLGAPPIARRAYRNGLKALRRAQPDFRKAAKFFERTLEIHPEHAPGWAALGEARAALEDEDGAQEAFARSIESDPNLLQPYDAMIQIAVNARDWEKLDTLTAKYLQLETGSARVRFYSAVAALELNDISRAESIVERMEEFGETDEWPISYLLMGLAHERLADFESAADYYEKYIETSTDADTLQVAQRKIYDWGHLLVIEPRSVVPVHTTGSK